MPDFGPEDTDGMGGGPPRRLAADVTTKAVSAGVRLWGRTGSGRVPSVGALIVLVTPLVAIARDRR